MSDRATSHPTARRPGGRTARVRARALAATVELLAQYGIAGFSYEDVARTAEVHKATIYRNWPDRDTLVGEALRTSAQDVAPISDTGDLRHDLVEFLTGLAQSLDSPAGRALIQVAQLAQQDPVTHSTVTAIFEDRVTTMQKRIDRAAQNGELPQVDGYLFTELLAGPVHAYLNRGLRPFTRTVAEQIVDIVLAGIQQTTS